MDRLVRKAQSGDKAAFVRLIEENQLTMYRTAKAILHQEADVEDAVQEAICRAFDKLCTLRQTIPWTCSPRSPGRRTWTPPWTCSRR